MCLFICKKWVKKKVSLMSFAFCSLLHLLSYRKKQFVRSLRKGTHLTVVAETISKRLVLYKYNSTKLFSKKRIISLLLYKVFFKTAFILVMIFILVLCKCECMAISNFHIRTVNHVWTFSLSFCLLFDLLFRWTGFYFLYNFEETVICIKHN